MKNLTIAILLLFSIAAKAQTPAPIKQPQISGYIFTPTGTINVPVIVTLSVNSGDLDAYIKVNAFGGPEKLQVSDVSAKNVTMLLQAYNRVVASFQPINDTLAKVLNRKYNEYIRVDQARQKADSTAKAKGVKP